jgi:outer membrane protein TolC
MAIQRDPIGLLSCAGAALTLALSACALTACAVGPNYHSPAWSTQNGYTPEALPAQTVSTGVAGRGGEVQRFEPGRDLLGEWWTLFGSTKLDALIGQAMANYPDIAARQAANVHQASANIGVATANLLPQLTLSAALGNASGKLATLAESSSGTWSLAGGITAPLFQGGSLRAKRRAAVDAYDQAVAQYRLAVLQAFQNVADILTALDNDAQALEAQRAALDAAQTSLDLAVQQYADGAVDSATLLTAQQNYQQARLNDVRALASRYTDTVTLFQQLGGGWWHRDDPGTLPGLR